MAAQTGRSFTLKVGDGATSEAFTTVAGMRSMGLTLNGEAVDITTKDETWRTLMAAAGIKSGSISGAGIFKDHASESTMLTNFLAQTLDNYQIMTSTGDYFQGAFLITSMEYTGEYNGARQYSLSMESSGEVSFTSV